MSLPFRRLGLTRLAFGNPQAFMRSDTNIEPVGEWVVVVLGYAMIVGSEHMLSIAKRLLRSVPKANVPEPERAILGCEAIVDREW
jgi:hypothetical protein